MGFVGMEGKFPSQEDCPGFEQTAKQFQAKSLELAMLLLGGFATGLSLPHDFFQKVIFEITFSPRSNVIMTDLSRTALYAFTLIDPPCRGFRHPL